MFRTAAYRCADRVKSRPFLSWGALVGILVLAIGLPHESFLVFAAVDANANSIQDTLTSTIQLLNVALQVMYIVIRPLLIIAGNAMDNSLVYGSFINMDAPLFLMWNMSKNFANFALGFYLLYEILKYVIVPDANPPKEIITKSLFAGVVIQSSRFILGALIDLSTIATYSIGGLPLTLMGETTIGQHPILMVNAYMDFGNRGKPGHTDDTIKLYYSRGGTNYASCISYKGVIIGRYFTAETKDIKDNKVVFQPDSCMYQGGIIVQLKDTDANKLGETFLKGEFDTQKTVDSRGGIDNAKIIINALLSGETDTTKIFGGLLMPDGKTPVPTATIDRAKIPLIYDGTFSDTPLVSPKGADKDTKFMNYSFPKGTQTDATPIYHTHSNRLDISKQDGAQGLTLGTLLEDNQGFVGPFATLFISLMDFGSLNTTDIGPSTATWTIKQVMLFFIKAGFGIAAIFPLIALAVVLIIRVGLLWILIAFSPLIALAIASGTKVEMMGMDAGDHKMRLGLIFAPVLPVFALSVSILFMHTLTYALQHQASGNVREGLGISINSNTKSSDGTPQECMEVFGLTSFCYDKDSTTIGGASGGDMFSWMIVNLFGVGVVWALLFMAIKQSKYAEGVVESVQKFGTSALGSIPIIPMPSTGGLTMVGTNAAGRLRDEGSNIVDQKLRGITTAQAQDVKDLFEPGEVGSSKRFIKEVGGDKAKVADFAAIKDTYKPKLVDQQFLGEIDENIKNKDVRAEVVKTVGEEAAGLVKNSLTGAPVAQTTVNQINGIISSKLGEEAYNQDNSSLKSALSGKTALKVKQADGTTIDYTWSDTNKQYTEVTETSEQILAREEKEKKAKEVAAEAEKAAKLAKANNNGGGSPGGNVAADTPGGTTESTTQ